MCRNKIVSRKKSKAQLRSHVASAPIIRTFGKWQINNNTRGYLWYFKKWICLVIYQFILFFLLFHYI